MSTWSNAVLTTQGANLLAKLANGATLTITSAYTGSGYVQPTTLVSQKNVTDRQQTLNLQPVMIQQAGTCTIPMTLTNTGLTTAYTATQVGVFAQDPDLGEILAFIAQAEEGGGTDIPSATEMPGYSAEWRFYLNYQQADNVTVTVSPALSVTQAQFDNHVNNTSNPHKVTAAQVGLGNVNNTSDINKPISTATQNALNQKADSGAVTGHINNTNNPHKVTAAQVGLGNVNNTSDANKPISTATQNALNTKQKKITYGTAAPSGGSNGDIYIQY